MSYEVSPGRILIYGKTRYPAGSLVPEVPGTDELLESGVIRVVETGKKLELKIRLFKEHPLSI